VFPYGPERAVYNNALLERDLAVGEHADALDAMEAAYASAGISQFAAWAHESDGAMRRDVLRRGYALVESTRAMGMALADVRLPRPEIDLGPSDWFEYLRVGDLPPGLLTGVDPSVFHVRVARLDGDCGIYNVGTVEHARRRGLGTAVTAVLVHDALERGCRTASLQVTEMAERVYAAVGFRGLGRFLEYSPGGSRPSSACGRAMRSCGSRRRTS
jgi:ribosomal protein S18 acetylase RimI-like enzyme